MITKLKATQQRIPQSVVLLALAIVFFVLLGWALFPLTVDDAYISFHFSDNLAHGHGLVWNIGEKPVEGYSNFLWVALGAGVIKLGLPIVTVMKLIGAGLGILCVVLIFLISKLDLSASQAVMPALLLGASPTLVLWSVAGLETSLYVALLLAALYWFLGEEAGTSKASTQFWSSALLFLVSLTRPEGIAVFGSLALARIILWIRRAERRPDLRRYLVWIGGFAGIWLIYFSWRWSYFGYPFPNTAYVKVQSGLGAIAGQIGVYLIPFALRIFPFVLLAVHQLETQEAWERSDIYLSVALASLLLANLVSSDWMPGHRLALATVPLVLLLARRPLGRMLQRALEGRHRQRPASALIVAGLICFMLTPLLYTTNIFDRVMATQMDMSILRWAREMETIVDGQYAKVGRWLADYAPPDAKVVAGNVGAIAFFSQRKVIDTIGLTDAYIARNGWTVDYLLSQNPEFIVLESDTSAGFGGLYGTGGEWFAATPAFTENYEQLAVLSNDRASEPALFLHYLPHATWVFARRDLNLKPQAQTLTQ